MRRRRPVRRRVRAAQPRDYRGRYASNRHQQQLPAWGFLVLLAAAVLMVILVNI